MTVHFPFDNSYARLGDGFRTSTLPTPVAAPRLLALNRPLARELGLSDEALAGPDGVAVLSGNRLPEGAEPLAAAYAGHQFGHFVPQLGDGRAVLLGEIVDRDGQRRDIQLKGAGPTVYSRSGDGRAAIGPVLREYLVSEAMAALGIPTTRALAAVSTGEPVLRETPLPGAVLTRVAASHVRVGTFQFFAARGDTDAVRRLADHVIERHDPAAASRPEPYRALLDGVCRRQASLVARWMQIGFVHGVMNTDNMSIAGETIDYGPCAFLDRYDPEAFFSSIDRGGRYAYRNQPGIALWNLTRLAECLLPLLDPDETRAIAIAEEVLSGFAAAFQAAHLEGFGHKIGIGAASADDAALIDGFLAILQESRADFTLSFRALGAASVGPGGEGQLRGFVEGSQRLDEWLAAWRARLSREPLGATEPRALMDRVNPAIIARNHLVEAALAAAAGGDLGPFDRLHAALGDPFAERDADDPIAARPTEPAQPYRTFCGT